MRCSASCENNQRRVAENGPAEAMKSNCQHDLVLSALSLRLIVQDLKSIPSSGCAIRCGRYFPPRKGLVRKIFKV